MHVAGFRLSVGRLDASSGRRHLLLLPAGALLLAVYGAVRLTGGAPNPLVHFAYLGVALAALGAGWRGGLAAGVAAGLLLGPLMPDSTAASASILGSWGWAVRLAAYIAAGGAIGWIWDLSKRVSSTAQERVAHERLRRTLEAMNDGILVFDTRGRLMLCNAAAERLLGITRGELLGTRYEDLAERVGLQRPSDAPAARERIFAALGAGQALPPAELTLCRPDGTECRLQVQLRALDPADPAEGLAVSLREVTAEHVLAQERSLQLVELQAAAQAAAAAASASTAAEALLGQFARTWPVVAAAIYLFDAGGTQRLAVWAAPDAVHPLPPLVPSEAADELRTLSEAGPQRTGLARLPGVGQGASILAERGAHSLLVVPLVDRGVLVGALLAGGRPAPEPLSAGEEAHLRAMGGLAAGIVHRAVEDEEAARQRVRQRVLGVLANPQLLVPRYQPILDLASRAVAGYEALASFQAQPGQPPNVWFAQAAEVGLGAELQALAIERERSVARSAALPAGVFLSLNVSPRYLGSPPVQRALGGGSLRRLVIEVTEEEAVADYAALRDATAPYLARGARVAVDDAGAGYASMRHVTELRPDFVKLDALLIRGLRDDTARQALVRALASFTTAIGATTIAEGVEEPADLALLARSRQSLLAQGYAIARPGPPWPAVTPGLFAPPRGYAHRNVVQPASQPALLEHVVH